MKGLTRGSLLRMQNDGKFLLRFGCQFKLFTFTVRLSIP